MSAALAQSRDRAVSTLRLLGATVVVLGLTGTGALAGVFARQHAEPEAAPAGQTADATLPRRVIVVVHRPDSAPVARAAAPAPAPVPTVAAPAEPVAPAGTSSGSDPS